MAKLHKDIFIDGKKYRVYQNPDGKVEQVLLDSGEQKGENMDLPMMDDLEVEGGVTEIQDAKDFAVKFGFLGGGQAGGKLCEEFYKLGYRRLLAVNTTTQDFDGLTFQHKVIIGDGLNGAGKDPSVGYKAADESREQILRACKEAFGNDVEHIMVMASTGGGTGSGSCEVLIEVAKDYLKSLGKEPKVGVIACLPKQAEGAKVLENSKRLMGKLTAMVDSKQLAPLVVSDNEKILKMYPKVSVAKFHEAANRNVAGLFSVFNDVCSKSSAYQTLDRADYRSILASGIIVFGATKIKDAAKTETAIAETIEKNLKAGLLASVKFAGATHAGAILLASKDMLENIPQSSFDLAFQSLNRSLGGSILLHSGVYEGPEALGEDALVYSVIGGIPSGQLH